MLRNNRKARWLVVAIGTIGCAALGRTQAGQLAELAPAAGHIVHMPAHVYIRTGDYEAAVKANERAAQ